MIHLYSRSVMHERVIEAVPDTRFHRTTILSSEQLDGTLMPIVFEGALNRSIIRAYVTQTLVPSPKPGDIVVMNTQSSHEYLLSGLSPA